MGTLYEEAAAALPLLRDLKVTIQSTCLVFPSKESDGRSMFLSNIDQVLNFDVQTVHFFASHKDFPPQVVAQKLKNALENLLVPYDFLAGRLKVNPKTDRLEIECNGAGAGFVVATSECRLEEMGDLVYPNPAFQQLVAKTMQNHDHRLDKTDQPLCILQVTSFKCGGFAMGIQTNHAALDGLSFKTFLGNLAALAADKSMSVTPCNDRRLLGARSPPVVTFPHPELMKLESAAATGVFEETTQEDLEFNIFRLSSEDISVLKQRAAAAAPYNSSFNVVTALIWKCKALSTPAAAAAASHSPDDDDDNNNTDYSSTILYAVNIRPRMSPPLPASYAGNAVLSAYATATLQEIREAPFWKLAEMVGEGANRITDEYARSVIDWGEIHRGGFPHGDLLVSSWWKLGFDQVTYPWGCPIYCCPVVYRRKNIILLFNDLQDYDGVNVLVALPSLPMLHFRTLFRNTLNFIP